jgi:hypothetical protein
MFTSSMQVDKRHIISNLKIKLNVLKQMISLPTYSYSILN